jgi:glycosyltransferase involved in cell wall biosynthesis
MKVSVVIVNYNGEKYIKQCVDSVLKSAGAKFEVVIVENGSTDGSLK